MIRFRIPIHPRAPLVAVVAAALITGLLCGTPAGAITVRSRPHAGAAVITGAHVGKPVPAAIRAAKNRMRATPADLGYSVSLTETRSDGGNPLHPEPGQSVTMTATSSVDVGPTPYYIEIYNTVTRQLITWCGDGTTCSLTVTENTPVGPGAIGFTAFIADLAATMTPPDVQAWSYYYLPSWLNPLQASGHRWSDGSVSISTDTGGAPISFPWAIEIYDVTTGKVVTYCEWGQSCVTQAGDWASYSPNITGCTCMDASLVNGSDSYWVIVARAFPVLNPPSDIRDWADHYV
jgi:hypothetical protein